ncbi:MAG: ATP synthase F1 subunit epsilon [Parvularcula sp.]|jgi:F-type H+-transporting ATPase subunit epsilon|nr:ATP synthase F1 subunit epsilon [Parvularcula sp.]
MAEKIAFSLVSPERELFSGQVDAVAVPGTEGTFEVRAGHAPLMATLSPGILEVHDGGQVRRTFVKGGFADVSASGLTILAERAINDTELQGEVLTNERRDAEAVLADNDRTPEQELNARRAVDALSRY